MAKVKIETEVSKEIYEAAQGLGKFGLAVKQALADGWQLGQDLPVVMASALSELVPGLQGIEKAADEVKEDALASVDGFIQGIKPMVAELLKKSA